MYFWCILAVRVCVLVCCRIWRKRKNIIIIVMNQRTTATQQWRIHNRGQGAMVQMTILGTPLQHCGISVPEWVTSSCCRHYVIALDEYGLRAWPERLLHQTMDWACGPCIAAHWQHQQQLCSQSVIARPENIRSRDTATSRCSSRRRAARSRTHFHSPTFGGIGAWSQRCERSVLDLLTQSWTRGNFSQCLH